ncbi:SH3 domain protein [Yokenella regensburgei]|jgi:SH3 domain protein|uniref:SH3 domain protein n=2 Tax=Yokenella regensburgei TaxID=158877 RepID=A0AB38G160_9ENTR|nr:SH3 domain protein [Yokenella regensburgei ATCC 43003]KFD23117.1 arylsulfatase [Yokenella regensburgei ATCC 49455]RKR54625.1 SH3 domain protein [Yokenella regensburgei]SQA64743.1 SH3 domain-containing protein [Yokenella regensburgei]SQA95631.1 SH3 domain-containing protein [Yokenella regensburgei]
MLCVVRLLPLLSFHFYDKNDDLMRKLRLIGLTLLALSVSAGVHAEEKRYVSDELNTWVRSGPGDNYRLVGTINAGEQVALLQTDSNTNYAQVRDGNGRTAWIPLKELSNEPSLRTRVPDLENQVKTLTDKLNNIDATWNQRTADMQKKVSGSDNEINGLKEENQKLKNQLIVAQKKVNAANLQLDDKQRTIIMQWFMYGGGVLGVGLILGLVLPHLIPSRKRKDRWMN